MLIERRLPKVFSLTLALLALSGLTRAVFAGRPTALPQNMNFSLEGKITKASPGQLTISTDANIIFHVRYDDKTEIKRPDGSKGSAKDFHPGLKVKVEGDLTETGEVIAQKIELEPAG